MNGGPEAKENLGGTYVNKDTNEKKKSGAILAASAGVFIIALSISSFFLVQIIGRMNRSANQNLLTSSRVISGGLNNKICRFVKHLLQGEQIIVQYLLGAFPS